MTLDDARRADIVHHVLAMTREQPCDSITISGICAEARISKNTFYKFFKSKEELFCTLYLSAETEILTALPRILLAQASPLHKYWSIWHYFIRKTVSMGPDMVAYINQCSFSLEGHDLTHHSSNEIQHTQLELLRQAQQAGQIRRDLPVEELSNLCWFYYSGLKIGWCKHGGEYDLLETVFGGLMSILCAQPDFSAQDRL